MTNSVKWACVLLLMVMFCAGCGQSTPPPPSVPDTSASEASAPPTPPIEDPESERRVTTSVSNEDGVIRFYNFSVPFNEYDDVRFDQTAEPTAVPNAVRFAYKSSGSPAVFLQRLDFVASQLDSVKIIVTATHMTEEDETPVDLKGVRLYWAAKQDIPVGGGWPYSESRAVNFTAVPQEPGVWTVNPAEHELWNGIIDRMFCSLVFDPAILTGESDSLNVYLKTFMLLGNKSAIVSPESESQRVYSPVKAWNFSELDKDHWDWSFPAATPEKNPRGLLFGMAKNGILLQLKDVSFSAKDFGAVRIEIRAGKSKAAIKSLDLHWTRAGDGVSGSAPKTAPSVRFVRDVADANVWVAAVGDIKTWDGMIASLSVNMEIAEQEMKDGGSLDVCVKKIELVR